jgi:hypothetical protein
MKNQLFKALLLGLILTALSLLYHTGDTSKEPMPYTANCGGEGRICNGYTAYAPSDSLSNRGFPMAIVSLSADEDEPGNYYHGLNVVGLVVDYTLASLICFGLIVGLDRMKRKKTSSPQR